MNKKNTKRMRIIDAVLTVLMLAIACGLLYLAQPYIPSKFFIPVAIIAGCIVLIFASLIFLKQANWVRWVKRVFMVFIIAALSVATFYVYKGDLSLAQISETNDNVVYVDVVVKKGGEYTSLDNLKNETVGIQSLTNSDEASYGQTELNKEVSNITYVEELDSASMYEKVTSGEIAAMVIPRTSLNTLRSFYEGVDDNVEVLTTYEMVVQGTENTTVKDITSQPFTVLLSGMDEGTDPNVNGRSDVNIVLLVDPISKHIEMFSIPRDSYVPNPALNYENDKLTHLGNNGIDNIEKGIEAAFGIEIDYYIKLNFFSVIEIIDTVGGIEATVPASFCEQDENRSFAESDLICLTEGLQHLDGQQTLAMARHRKTYGDLKRGMAQQEIIRGFIDKISSPEGITKISSILDIAPQYVSTDIPTEQIRKFIASNVDDLSIAWTIHSNDLTNGESASLYTASYGGGPLSCYLLNKDDVRNVMDVYFQFYKNQMVFSTFAFDFGNWDPHKGTLQTDYPIVWSGEGVRSEPNQVDDGYTPDPSIPELNVPTTPEPTTPPTDPGGSTETPPTDPGGGTETPPTDPGGGTETPPTDPGGDDGSGGTETPPPTQP